MSRTWLLIACLLSLTPTSSKAVDVDYLGDIKPLLTAKCVACHGPLRQKGNLRLDTAKFLIKGGESGSAIVANDSAKSLLIEAILGANGRTKMPIDGEPLKPEQLELLRKWIDAGAKAPDDEPVADPRDHWAFKKPIRSVAQAGRMQSVNTIDSFIAAEHLQRGLSPLSVADKATLLRRVFIDLVGLPPTSDELQEFLNDDSPDAYERIVDRLLESPEHAQRWARHWMDIWRYSDWYGSRGGNELRNSRRHIWRWRDWIIESLAANKPYDRMIVEMLAADEVAPGDRDIGRANGFLGRHYYVFNRNVWLQDTVEFTSSAFLGLTFKCCRCHDHKYDPLAQEEYFRLRAFFEPHNVRTDQLVGKREVIAGQWPTGAPPGHTLKDGDDWVFDADLTTPTYLFDRGNEKNPVTDKPLKPGVPSVLNLPLSPIEQIALPLTAYYPDLRPERRQELIDNAKAAITQAEADVIKKHAAVEAMKRKTGTLAHPERSDGQEFPTYLDDHFTAHNKDIWKILSGDWAVEDQKLKLKSPGHFLTIATQTTHPQDFKATLKYRTLPGGAYGSVGMFFDMVELKEAQAVYTHVNANSSGVQAFHRTKGVEHYPAAGIVATPLKLSEEINLEITARGQELKIWVNGELKLTYAMPTPRQPGRFALWCHAGLAEFTSLKIVPFEPSLEELQLAMRTAESDAVLATKLIDVARSEAVAIEARIAADVTQAVRQNPVSESATTGAGTNPTQASRLSYDAGRAERLVVLEKTELEALRARQQLDALKFELLNSKSQNPTPKQEEALKAAEAKLTTIHTAVETAKTNAAKEDATYTPIGPTYPTTSTGRRFALAKWITHKDNPLTARVAVNHIWKRHFGTALVPSVANFGLNGKKPTHPELLDWLAVEFMESGWNMKHLHRLMVTSSTYRRSSSETSPMRERGIERDQVLKPEYGLAPSLASRANNGQPSSDADNRYYWRANIRRMDAEVVRDTLWSLTNGLDRSFSGPELDPVSADTAPRRSLYFRHTPDDQATMLELFDGPSAAECFERTDSIMPQQALSLANSSLALTQSRLLARELSQSQTGAAPISDADFIRSAFERVLSRSPQPSEVAKIEPFLQRQATALTDISKLTPTTTGLNSSLAPSSDPRLRARENLVHVLLNYHEFVTVR
ncbi:MAG: DUF1553 domain-containing protein [Planctomycetia bacterium]|nr:DUF1553 domain-containing protein [Planctomycetia bacterium]